MTDRIVYFSSCADLIHSGWTKIGSTENWVNRSSTYKTSFPLNNLTPYFIIRTKRHTLVETIFLKKFKKKYSSTRYGEYNDGGSEWITKKLTIDDIKKVLEVKDFNVEYTLLYGDELTKFLADAKRKVNELEQKRLKKLEDEYDEWKNQLDLLTADEVVESKDKSNFPYDLRGYQVEAFTKINQLLTCLTDKQFNQIIKLYIMCRCGKTVLFQKIAFDYINCFDVLVYVCPRLNLIENMISRWVEIFPSIRMAELSSSKGKYCIDDDELVSICQKKTRTILFVCNDSFQRLIPLLNAKMRKMFIFDEAHYLASKKTDKHPLILMKKNKGSSLIVFATATPVIGNYISRTDYIFMNDIKYFGDRDNVIYYNDIEDAIKNKFMTPASIFVGAYDLKDTSVDTSHNLRSVKSIAMVQDLLNKDLPYKPRKILMYANGISSVNNMYKLLRENSYFKNIKVFKMTSQEKFKKNTESLSRFVNSQKISILINCRMVTDGINIPKLDTVVFIDPRYNKADLIQIISRPRSYCHEQPNKIAYILIPQIYKSNGQGTDDNGFETVISIIEELHINNDPTVVKYVSELVNGNKKMTSHEKRHKEFQMLQLDERIKVKIMELTKERMVRKSLSLPQTIVHVLSDNNPRSSGQIWQEISEKKLWSSPCGKTPSASCSAACGTIFRKGLIGRKKIGRLIMYFNIQKIKQHISTQEFSDMLIEEDIKCQDDYYKLINGMYDEVYVVEPETHYEDFSWKIFTSITRHAFIKGDATS